MSQLFIILMSLLCGMSLLLSCLALASTAVMIRYRLENRLRQYATNRNCKRLAHKAILRHVS